MEKNKDVTFKITKVRGAYRHRAVRAAVFRPGLTPSWPRDPLAAHQELRAVWRDYLTRLRGEKQLFGATPEKDALAHQYARNCPPTGTAAPRWSQLVPCKKRLICPYCWGRNYALEAFLLFERLLYGGTDPKAERLVGDEYELFSLVKSQWWGGDLESEVSTLRALAAARCRFGRPDRGDGVRRLDGHLGAVVFHRVDFAPERGVTLTRSTLAVTPAGTAARFGRGAKASPLTKKALAAAVAEGFAWPSGVLRLSAANVGDLLSLFRNQRMFTRYPARAQSRN